ncbi:hypothetical protein [Streptomyces sp. UNOB3_S3]|uniref:hypothetical protein n=1 Tax=Streptomyces sp. UNOB3_S3 TaxID=2871682 RepID=UPI001E3DF247|nr:hypothetical protein [Streptomyces sp. UNOB3_S3]MCC3780032.1 hypothetical protein [Streptomyces sp. UNOB3_S3]
MTGKRGIGVASSSLALIATCLGWAPPAGADGHGRHAHGQPVACQGQENTSYRPGLTLTPRRVGIRAHASYTCSDRPGRTVAAAGDIAAVSPDSTCLALDTPRGHEVVRYGDGSVSEIDYSTGHAGRVLGFNAVRLSGVVVKGRDKGAMAERIIELAPTGLPVGCLTPEGVRQAGGVVQLRIVP